MKRFVTAAAVAALLLLAACSGGSNSLTPTAAPTPSPTSSARSPSTSNELGAAEFDPARAFAHVEALTTEIGARPAGSDAERDAARYLRDQLLSFGYDVEVLPFTFALFADAGSSLTVTSPQTLAPAVYPFEPNVDGAVEGRLVAAGIGQADDFPADTEGAIALMGRGALEFQTKVANAAAAGAIAALIYNDEPGLYAGRFTQAPDIPALSLSQGDGQALLDLLASGPASARLEVKTESGTQRSQNVVARPPDGSCRVLAGGHYDTVAAGPGANDNASGTATVVEMARVLAADGEYGDVCFALFGAEEVGLVGSARFVDAMTDEQLSTLKAMLNLDMTGTGPRLLLAGPPSIADAAEAEAKARDLTYFRTGADELAGSDHASFLAAGVPAIFLHSFTNTVADDPHYHTAEDKPEYIQRTRLAEIGSLAAAVIGTLLGG